jgi:MFS family permease
LVWGAAIAAYAVAVLHRSSLGVAAVEAAERFDIGATVLSTFVVVQLAVYAGMQVPLGVLLDRFGSRVLIGSGAVLMAIGQLLLGLVDDLPSAYLARVLIGAGDAATFISAIRLVPAWFPARRVPLFTQLTGIAGHVGQLAAAFPLVAAIGAAGWSPAFVGLGAVGAFAAILAWVGVRDRPAGAPRQPRTLSVGQNLRDAVRTPGTWLGFWTHVIGYFPVAVFLLLWGFPFLTEAQGLAPAQASVVMSMNAVAAVLSGPVVGLLTSRHPLRRSWMVLTFASATAVAWAAVLLRPGPSPMWLLAVLVLVLGVGGPVSAIGFDYARTSNPTDRLGTAIGVVNVGGFSVAVAVVLAIGVVLDAVGGDTPMSLPAFRVAFAVQAVPLAVAVLGVLVTRRGARGVLLAEGVVLAPVREVLARRRAERNGAA